MKKTLIISAALLLTIAAGAQTPKDTTRVLCIGNSFTYVAVAHEKLCDIALSEGHYLDMEAAYVGGHSFYRHLTDLQTQRAIEQFDIPWDFAFLQNQSQLNALYGQNPKQHKLALKDAVDLVNRIRQFSPKAKIFFEQTWAYSRRNYGGFGDMVTFDNYLAKGTQMMAKKTRTNVSPIGEAFKVVRTERPDIQLYKEDNHHQWEYGSYLKACVNYLLIFGTRFDDAASCCGLDAETCKYLRSVAERVIL